MLLIDSHLDLSWNALGWNRDITLSVADIRASEQGMTEKGRGVNTVSLPELRRAEVFVSLATVLARANPKPVHPLLDFRNQEIACAVAQGQRIYYRLLEAQGHLRLLCTGREIRQHAEAWMASGGEGVPLGYVLSMEGADPIVNPNQFDEWFDQGLRVIGLAHYGPGAYACGTGSQGGLSACGRELLARMDERGAVLDATHIAEQSFWEALAAFRGPVLASHNNCRALVPGDRQFSDDQIRALVERGAVIGVAFDAWMLKPGYVRRETARTGILIDTAVDHIDHICQLAGNARHAAIGSDLDGGYGTEQCPEDLETIYDLQKIPDLLRRRGYAEADVEAVMYGNWLRFLEGALG